MEKITYGDFAIDASALPEASLFALLSRGFTHVLGNEIASRVHAWCGAEGQANSDDKATIKAWKEANESAVAEQTAVLRKAAFDAIVAGTLGVRVGGPRVEPIDQAKASIARVEVLKVLAANGIKAPKKDEKVRFANGTEKSMAEMIASRLAHPEHGPRITKEAEKALAAKAKKFEELAKSKVEGDVDADALGI